MPTIRIRTPNIEHAKYGNFKRTRRSKRLRAYLTSRATALEYTAQDLFKRMMKVGTRKLRKATTSFPVVITLPTITGTPTNGLTLTNASPGTWGAIPDPTFTRVWKRDNVVIAGQTGTTLILSAPDVGKRITIEVTATNSVGSAKATSLQTAVVA